MFKKFDTKEENQNMARLIAKNIVNALSKCKYEKIPSFVDNMDFG